MPAIEQQQATVVQTVATMSAPSGVLVVGRGSAAKQAVKTCIANGINQVFITGFSAKPFGEERQCGATVVPLGAKESPQLWRNDYALVQAIQACRASTVLFAVRGMEPSALLLMLARSNGWNIYHPLEGDKLRESWVLAQAPAALKTWEPKWRRCPKCKLVHDVSQQGASVGCCPECGSLYRMDSQERIDATFDVCSFVEDTALIPEPDPLEFPGYQGVLERNRKRSGHDEGVRCGVARLYGLPVAVCVMESAFMMGSMGYVVGEKITRCIERATREGLPLVIFTASGGARMQEGLVSLMQMAKTSAALQKHSEAGLPYFSVITDPTTGGVTASFAMLGDVIAAEPGALIGFAGRRVIQDTIKQVLPDDFQTAEFALEHGLIDAVVDRADMRAFLAQCVRLFMTSTANGDAYMANAATMADIIQGGPGYSSKWTRGRGKKRGGVLKRIFGGTAATALFSPGGEDDDASNAMARALHRRDVADMPGLKPQSAKAQDGGQAWENVLLARNVHRPTSCYYIDKLFSGFIELHGDREFGDDGAIVGGVAWFGGKPVTVIAEEKGADLDQRIARNFGCPHPEGYRKAMRLMQQAEKFNMPIICLVDTQGAYCGKEAEERGMGGAIAQSMQLMASLAVPVVSVVLGEAGSGGALAIAVSNIVGMQEHSVYSVLSPEGFASILWKDGSRAAEAAGAMKMCAPEVLELGIVDAVIPEGDAPAHENPGQAVEHVREFLTHSLNSLKGVPGEQLKQQRYRRFRAF